MKTNELKTTRDAIGARLFALAVAWSRDLPGTQKDRDEMIKSARGRKKTINGSKSIRSAREAVEAAAREISQSRRTRGTRRSDRALGYCPTGPVWGYTRRGDKRRQPSHVTPAKQIKIDRRPIADRLYSFRCDAISGAIKNYRFDRPPRVDLTDNPASVGVAQSDYLDWDYYAKSCKYPKKIVSTLITVPAAWRIRVLKRGLAEVGGMMTLDAQEIKGMPPGISVFFAVWLAQGRGYELRNERGFIAIAGDIEYHADSIDAAIRGISKKLKTISTNIAINNLLDKHGIEKIISKFPNLTVTISDALATGACEYGIRSWCHAVELDYDAGAAPLADVYTGYQSRPISYARGAIIHALRRNKKAVLQAA